MWSDYIRCTAVVEGGVQNAREQEHVGSVGFQKTNKDVRIGAQCTVITA